MNKNSNVTYIYDTIYLSNIAHKKKSTSTYKNRKKFLRSIRKSNSSRLISNIYQQQSGCSVKTFQGGSVGSRR
jgi:hypothetical protein